MNMKEQEIRGFQSEVKQLLHLMIHSLYSNKEIFLRELISNASDAADKLRFKAILQSELYENDSNLKVRISADKNNNSLIISDNGIGMTREEVIDNLGTIAKSGTKEFLESLKKNEVKDSQLIGQFGVGFYSAFIVAEEVMVRTRAAGVAIDKGVYWKSSGDGEYTIANIEKINRGTEITLKLRSNQLEFLDNWKLRAIINKYSDHIILPIELKNENNNENKNDNADLWEQVNKAQAIWVRNKNDITDSEYKEFYKYISHDQIDPLIWSHNKVEGKQEYISILYIPKKASFDLWNQDNKHGLKLYIKRVFIMDDAKYFIPTYLRFVKGLIDSSTLPLNISREILQESIISKNIKNSLTKNILKMLEKLAKSQIDIYQNFWNEFGLIFKEGLAEDTLNKAIITNLLRFSSTYNNSAIQNVSLEDYSNRMLDNQQHIFYITADNYIAAKNSPHLEPFRKKNIEVLLLFDRIDEWMLNYLPKFKDKTFQLISKTNSDIDKLHDDIKDEEASKKNLEPFIQRIKKILGERIKDVKITYRLTDTPVIVTTNADDMSTHMAKLFTAVGQPAPKVKYNFEINPKHLIIKKIIEITDETIFAEWIELLYNQAILVEQGNLENPSEFIHLMNKLLVTQ
uniref:Chaperone protein HtpG n=1 Tax=Candidatus Aschnera chinzeii TaxID=1485666 RepID=A0AAT9G4Y3_9ENTR|nr:MAG: molecular chaperone HtpG [Candidatus Aschnera chinzeii]